MSPRRRSVVLVTGLSGAGKTSILHTLEDLGYETIDNLPIALVGGLVARGATEPALPPLAIGVDARTRDFTAAGLIGLLADLRADPRLQPDLVFATAQEDALLRRYTETRRRHPLAPAGRVRDGIAAEAALLGGLREAADLLVDTSELPSPMLRRLIEARFGHAGADGLTVSLVSFAYPRGLPREADLVLDARFLRNPHYDAVLRPLTGLDPAVAAYVTEDPDFQPFFDRVMGLLQLLLPRFVQEGKRYVTVGIGCTGGRHRSVHVVEMLTNSLAFAGWRVTRAHRELTSRDLPDQPLQVGDRAPASGGDGAATAAPAPISADHTTTPAPDPAPGLPAQKAASAS